MPNSVRSAGIGNRRVIRSTPTMGLRHSVDGRFPGSRVNALAQPSRFPSGLSSGSGFPLTVAGAATALPTASSAHRIPFSPQAWGHHPGHQSRSREKGQGFSGFRGIPALTDGNPDSISSPGSERIRARARTATTAPGN